MSISPFACGSSTMMALRFLVFVLVLRHTQTEGMDATKVFCPDTGECTLQLRLQKMEEFFNRSLPENINATSYLGLGDIGQFFARKIGSLYGHINAKELTKQFQHSREGRQYYTTGTDFGTGYGVSYPGYNYGTGTESSTTFNGLDAALSALAFLAFGVWLFNLVLPQLQVAGLGVPGLGRRTGQADSRVRESKESSDHSVISKIFTSNQELINNIFHKVNGSSDGSFVRIRESVFPSSLVKMVGNLVTEYGQALWQAFQGIWRPGEQIPREKEKKRSLVSKSKNRWGSHRWKPKTKGRGLLEDLLGQVWKPFSFIAKLISPHHTDHQFPNSRTETVNGNVDRLDGDLYNLVNNSLSDLWNGKMNSLDADPLIRNSLEHKERHRHGTDLV